MKLLVRLKMKLRNKKTGEIGEIGYIGDTSGKLNVEPINGVACETIASYNSLAELNAEWEDYEEPKEYWCISENGVVGKRPYPIGIECVEQENRDEMRGIGNYFETEEEAEKAVEKLKAWKRLKDRGFKFTGYNACSVDYDIDEQYRKYISQDLDLLFGGEE